MVRLFTAAQEVPLVPGSAPLAPIPTTLEPLGERGDTVLARHVTGKTETTKNPQRSYTDDAALQAISSLTGSDLGDP